MKNRFLRAIVQRDLNIVRRALFLTPVLERGTGSPAPPPGRPEEIGWDPRGEEQGAAEGVAGIGPDRPDHDIHRREDEQEHGPGVAGNPE